VPFIGCNGTVTSFRRVTWGYRVVFVFMFITFVCGARDGSIQDDVVMLQEDAMVSPSGVSTETLGEGFSGWQSYGTDAMCKQEDLQPRETVSEMACRELATTQKDRFYSYNHAHKWCTAHEECAISNAVGWTTFKYGGSFTGQIEASMKGSCLERDGDIVHLQRCDANALEQQWTYSPATQQLQSHDGRCLRGSSASKTLGETVTTSSRLNGVEIATDSAGSSGAENSTADTSGSSGVTAEGAGLVVRDCSTSGDASQSTERWHYTTSTGQFEVADGCLSLETTATEGASIHIGSCPSSQAWELNTEAVVHSNELIKVAEVSQAEIKKVEAATAGLKTKLSRMDTTRAADKEELIGQLKQLSADEAEASSVALENQLKMYAETFDNSTRSIDEGMQKTTRENEEAFRDVKDSAEEATSAGKARDKVLNEHLVSFKEEIGSHVTKLADKLAAEENGGKQSEAKFKSFEEDTTGKIEAVNEHLKASGQDITVLRTELDTALDAESKRRDDIINATENVLQNRIESSASTLTEHFQQGDASLKELMQNDKRKLQNSIEKLQEGLSEDIAAQSAQGGNQNKQDIEDLRTALLENMRENEAILRQQMESVDKEGTERAEDINSTMVQSLEQIRGALVTMAGDNKADRQQSEEKLEQRFTKSLKRGQQSLSNVIEMDRAELQMEMMNNTAVNQQARIELKDSMVEAVEQIQNEFKATSLNACEADVTARSQLQDHLESTFKETADELQNIAANNSDQIKLESSNVKQMFKTQLSAKERLLSQKLADAVSSLDAQFVQKGKEDSMARAIVKEEMLSRLGNATRKLDSDVSGNQAANHKALQDMQKQMMEEINATRHHLVQRSEATESTLIHDLTAVETNSKKSLKEAHAKLKAEMLAMEKVFDLTIRTETNSSGTERAQMRRDSASLAAESAMIKAEMVKQVKEAATQQTRMKLALTHAHNTSEVALSRAMKALATKFSAQITAQEKAVKGMINATSEREDHEAHKRIQARVSEINATMKESFNTAKRQHADLERQLSDALKNETERIDQQLQEEHATAATAQGELNISITEGVRADRHLSDNNKKAIDEEVATLKTTRNDTMRQHDDTMDERLQTAMKDAAEDAAKARKVDKSLALSTITRTTNQLKKDMLKASDELLNTGINKTKGDMSAIFAAQEEGLEERITNSTSAINSRLEEQAAADKASRERMKVAMLQAFETKADQLRSLAKDFNGTLDVTAQELRKTLNTALAAKEKSLSQSIATNEAKAEASQAALKKEMTATRDANQKAIASLKATISEETVKKSQENKAVQSRLEEQLIAVKYNATQQIAAVSTKAALLVEKSTAHVEALVQSSQEKLAQKIAQLQAGLDANKKAINETTSQTPTTTSAPPTMMLGEANEETGFSESNTYFGVPV